MSSYTIDEIIDSETKENLENIDDVKDFAENTYKAVTGRKRNVQQDADRKVKERESTLYKVRNIRNGIFSSLGNATAFVVKESVDAFWEGYHRND